MSDKSGSHEKSPADELFAVPPAQFVAARNQLAQALRKAGNKADAAAVKALTKPSPTVWVANQLARRHPDQMQRFLEISDELWRAQSAGAADEGARLAYQTSLQAQREALEPLLEHVAAIAAEHKIAAGRAVIDRIANNLRWSAINQRARDSLVKGQLLADLEPPDFSALVDRIPLLARPAGQSGPQAFAAARTRVPSAGSIRPSNDRDLADDIGRPGSGPKRDDNALQKADAKRRAEARQRMQALKEQLKPLEAQAQRTRAKVSTLASKREHAQEALKALQEQLQKAEAAARVAQDAHDQAIAAMQAEGERLTRLRGELADAAAQAKPAT